MYTVTQNHALDPYTNKDMTYSDAYDSGCNYDPKTSALSAQSSYYGRASLAPHVDPSTARDISRQPDQEPWDFHKDPPHITMDPLRTPHSVGDMVGRLFGVNKENRSRGIEKGENVDAGTQEERKGERRIRG
ncbi:hypothetical protein K435DRAFT_863560 [Dendrothele bispora CBS 962.96]|uniref:Pal1-domain-containing protein n=1 Tax=Dendrothele bispora (strain CBS 962.96) TaxID=1314807 RepID=A0A4S8LPI4_DENBC|nr:hypothetical protein K435DRAFT_863560 [Dendrothele bispora CBS 962.96]